MNGTTHIKAPAACTPHELESFERMVRLGFGGSNEDLPVRIRQAHRLAFHYGGDGTLVAIAGLKAPHQPHREEIFARAAATADPVACEFELGWLFVATPIRQEGLGRDLCRRLLADGVNRDTFAKTRTDNKRMKRILHDLGFRPSGRSFPHRDEELDLYFRP